jgi:hypothetical protein
MTPPWFGIPRGYGSIFDLTVVNVKKLGYIAGRDTGIRGAAQRRRREPGRGDADGDLRNAAG